MAKQLNIDLRFNADTNAAKAQLQSLQQSINQLTNNMAVQGTQFGITTKIQEAQQAAIQLKTALQQSMNVETGRFDLSKFNSSLKSMNSNLSSLKTQLTSLGPTGQQTFMTLAQSIMTAEIPTKRISASLATLGTTLKNTAKWQLSSSMLHGFMTAIQTSYRYAQDLNQSLNNIRIVTGESAEAMDKFAIKANKAAKALSASTLDYTNAALIYFQQGLNEKQVEERTEVTLKMANVSRQSAEIVSDQMTAIWNNFYDGSKSLEYYADVMTALGAATASSTDEIAGGLEKFAAIGETIGLSYEYAASALATITANTRQSEDVVGTALKTIFARIQGLKLGETLEDGTELNKYSEALQTIGISIFEQNGELKNMDNILNEMGAKWNTLSKAQQTALAQTVAGVRQYNQLISLMDNWEDMQKNLDISYNSQGVLQEQADIYAKSWEGASKRVKAAIEEVYSDLLNDDFFIGITNGLANVLGLLDNFLDSIGGAKGLLTGLGSILLHVFAGSAAKGLENMVYNFKSFIGLAKKEAIATKQQAFNLTQSMTNISASPVQTAITAGMQHQMELENSLLSIQDKLSASEQLQAKYIIEQNTAYAEQVKILAQAEEIATKKKIASQMHLNNSMERAYVRGFVNNDTSNLGEKMEGVYNTSEKVSADLTQTRQNLFKNIDLNDTAAIKEAMEKYKQALIEASQKVRASANGVETATEEMINTELRRLNNQSHGDKARSNYAAGQQEKQGINEFSRYSGVSAEQYGNSQTQVNNEMLNSDDVEVRRDARQVQNELRDSVRKTAQSFGEEKAAVKESEKGIKALRENTEKAKKSLTALGNTTASWSQIIVGAAQSVMSLSFAINSIISIFSTWEDETIGVGEKILQTFMSAGMAIPMLMNGFTGLGNAAKGYIGIMGLMNSKQAITNTLGQATIRMHSQEVKVLGSKVSALTAEQIVEKTGMNLDQAQLLLKQAQFQQITLNTLATNGYISVKGKEIIAKKLGITAEQTDIFLKKLQEGATWKQALAEIGATGVKKLFTKATWEQIKANAILIGQFIAMLWPIWAIIGALALLVGGIKLANSIYNKNANAAKEASEVAQKAAESFKEAQQAYEDLKSTISNYDNAIKGLAKLTEGTIEYKEQIMKANEEALKLIDSQNLLYGKDYVYDKNGLIKFTDGTLNRVQEEEFNNLERQQAYRDFTAQRAKTAQKKADLTEFARSNLKNDMGMQSEDWGALAKGAAWSASGAAIGAILGTVVPGIGNAIGAGGGALVGLVAGSIAGLIDVFTDEVKGSSSKNEMQSMYKLAEAYDKNGEEVLTPENIKKILGENNTLLGDVFAKPTAEMTKNLMEEKGISEDQINMDELNNLFENKGENITPEDLKKYFDNNGINIDQASIDQMFESVIDPEVKGMIQSLAENTAAIRAHIERTAASANQDNEAYQKLSDEDKSIADKIIANRIDDALADEDSEAYTQLEKDALAAWQAETQEAGKTAEKGFFKGNENLTYDKYMEITYGKDWRDNYKVEDTGGLFTAKKATVYKKDENNKWVNMDPDDKKNTLSNDEVKDAIVEYYAKQYSDADAAQLLQVSTQASEITSNIAGASNIMAYDIKSSLATGETVDFSFMSPGQIEELKAEIANGTIEVSEEYKEAIMNGIEAWSEEAYKARMEAEANSIISEGASKYELDEETLKIQAQMLQQTHEGLKDNAVAAAEMAVANQRMNQGVKKLCDDWEDWNKTLKSSDKTTQDYAEAVAGAQDAIKTMLGLAEDAVIPEDFLQNEENLELLDEIAKGSEEAVEKLHFNLTKAQIESEEFSADIAQNMIDAFDFGEDVDLEATFNEMKNQALSALTEIQAMANGIDIGAGLKDPAKQAELATKLNEYAMAAGWTAEQMQSALSSVGVRAKVTMVEGEPTTKKIPRTHIKRERTNHNPFDGTAEWVETSWVEGYTDVTEPTLVPQIEMEDPNNPGGQTTPIFEKVDMGNIAPSATASTSKSGGGGGSSAKPAEDTKKSDTVERYKEINDSLDNLTDALDDANKAADRLYGKARIDKMKQANAIIQQEISLLEKKYAKAQDYLAEDQAALSKAASEAGVSLNIEDGLITNYEEEMEKLYNQLSALIEAANADGNADEKEQEAIDKLQELIDNLKDAISDFDSTREEMEDLENELQDKFYEWQDNNYEILHYQMEIEIEINDLELEYIDYYLNKITDDFYSMAEAVQYMNSQIPTMTESLGHYENFYNDLNAAYAAGEISQAAYVEGLQESYSAILDQLSALNDLDKEMMHYYEDTLSAASDELAYYTDQMEHLTSVLDHYRSIVELVNGEYDYDSIGIILGGRENALKNEMDISVANYKMLLTEKAAIEEAYRNAQDEAARELYEQELRAITTQVNEAYDLMLSKTEEWAEASKAIMENTMAKAAYELEMALTNNQGFDSISSAMDRLSSYTDVYLTKTNQIYETQTLMNKIQQNIDKTTNQAAKNRLNSYNEEIKQLQEKNQLSKLELDIANARYEVLLAEIALEEAQNAKSTVRLQRDSEGNYGYVYTANQEAISNAEQDLLDAQNNLYNIHLEATEEWGNKVFELEQQLYDDLQKLEEERAAGRFKTDEEYYAARDKLIQDYDKLFLAYSDQYAIAIEHDAARQDSAWHQAYGNMVENADSWRTNTIQFTQDCEDAYTQWEQTVSTESEIIDGILNDLEQEVKDVTEESDALKDEVKDKVIPAIKDQLTSVRDVTSAYANQRTEIQNLINYYEQLTQSILETIRAQAQLAAKEAASAPSVNTTVGGNTQSDLNGSNIGNNDIPINPNNPTTVVLWQATLRCTNGGHIFAKGYKSSNALMSAASAIASRFGTTLAGRAQGQASGYNGSSNTQPSIRYEGPGMQGSSQSFDTGGYTGSWGPEGKLATLHEKELVLNKADTKNILSTVGIVRSISDQIEAYAKYSTSVNNMYLPSILNGGQMLEQSVQIEAHFPNATNHSEIEEAFNNLINTASQFANRKNL